MPSRAPTIGSAREAFLKKMSIPVLAVVALLVVGFLVLRGAGGGVSSDDAKQLVKDGAVLLDVRTTGEFSQGHLPGAINVPVQDLDQRLDELDPKKSYVVYCRSGARSARAKRLLESKGFSGVSDLGAMSRW